MAAGSVMDRGSEVYSDSRRSRKLYAGVRFVGPRLGRSCPIALGHTGDFLECACHTHGVGIALGGHAGAGIRAPIENARRIGGEADSLGNQRFIGVMRGPRPIDGVREPASDLRLAFLQCGFPSIFEKKIFQSCKSDIN